MIRRALGLAIAGLAIRAATARADAPVLHTEQCASLGAAELTAAVHRELALAPALAQRVASSVIEVEIACPDGVHAHVAVAASPTAGALVRDLDLGEEPPALQVKLVALAIAELIDASTSDPPPPPPAPALAPSSDTADVPRGLVAPVIVAPAPTLTVRGGARIIAGDEAALATLGAEIDLGPVRVGVSAAIGDGRRDYGRPYIVALTLSRAIACTHGDTVVCLVARAEGGFAGTSLNEDDEVTMPHSLYAGYGDLSAGFEIRRAIGGYRWVGNVDVGGADGLIFEQARLEHLDGPFAVIALGMQW